MTQLTWLNLTWLNLTRLILSLIIWHSRCTFSTLKSHLLNCTVLYSSGSLCTVFVTVNSFFLVILKFVFFFLFLLSLFVSFWSLFEFFFNLFLTPLITWYVILEFDLCHCNYYIFDLCLWSSLCPLISLYSIMSSSLRYWLDNAQFHLITILSLLLSFYNTAVMITINW